jgi:hypothetical protein
MAKPWNILSGKIAWIVCATAFVCGVSIGVFLKYATGIEHPVAGQPIKVEYCFLFSHEDLFRGQPVETDAHYMLGIEGAGFGKDDDCPEMDAGFSGPPPSDPIGKEWNNDIRRQPYPAEFNIGFVGVIPSYPRYRYWYWGALNHWQPVHHVPFIRIFRLTHFQRTR